VTNFDIKILQSFANNYNYRVYIIVTFRKIKPNYYMPHWFYIKVRNLRPEMS
jgi:hypothetical protein